MKFIKKMSPYLKSNWKLITVSLICMLIYAMLNASIAFILRDVVDEVFIKAENLSKGLKISAVDYSAKNLLNQLLRKSSGETVTKAGLQIMDQEQGVRYITDVLTILTIILIGLFIIKGVVYFFRKYLNYYIGEKIIYQIRNRIYEHLQTLSLQFFSEYKTGELMSRITNDVQVIENAIPVIGNKLVQEPLCFLALLGVMFYLDWKLTIIVFIIFPLILYPMSKLGKRMNKATKGAQEKMSILNAVIQEIISGIRIVKSFSMEKNEIEKFKKINRKFFSFIMLGHKAAALQLPINEMVSALAIGAILWYGGWNVVHGNMTTGTFLPFILILFQLYHPIRALSDVNMKLQQASASLDRIQEILDKKPVIVDLPGAVELKSFNNEIEFKNISFRYPNRIENCLEKINFKVDKGKVIAIVGRSGAGKSTLLDLIPRFFDPTEGEVLIDNRNITDFTIRSLRSLIGIVSQNTILFNDTVFNNIAYGALNSTLFVDPERLKNLVEESAKIANAHDFIMKLPEGYDSVIGERGTYLSGGEAQRISIARAILKNPAILILDEATSSLDTESERQVQDALNHLLKNRTVFAIAHRLSTIVNADNIIVLKSGEIVEQGSHEELFEKQGYYRHLYDLQFKV